MTQRSILLLCSLWLVLASPVSAADMERVLVRTSQGDFTLGLDREQAPVTVANFLGYVDDGFYDGTIFHRVIDGFMVQGGGFTEDFERKPTKKPIKNEADNGLKNLRGTIAMARTSDPNSATAQFFINVVDNASLDHRAPTPRGWGYAVFGQVVEGMETVDRIRVAKTDRRGRYRDVPVEAIVIESMERVEP